jgi:hypothetical protein
MKNIKLILALFLITQLNFAQDQRAFGVVVDSINNPIEGVNILIEGTLNSTKTDENGEFSIKVKYHNDFLIFSFTGMRTERFLCVNHKMKIKLLDINFKLSEVTPGPKLNKSIINHGYILKKNVSPKYNFTYNSVYNNYIIYIPVNEKIDSLDNEFQKKYNILYTQVDKYYKKKYYKRHNKLTFKFLNKKYNKTWLSEIRKDAIGLENLK